MKNYTNKYKDMFVFVFIIVIFILINSRIYSQSDNTILITNDSGEILGGDRKDWDFDFSLYKNFLDYSEFFYPPSYKDSGYVLTGETQALFSEINGNTVKLSWSASNLDIKEFRIERKNVISEIWEDIGKTESDGYSSLETEFKFVDHNIDNGIYLYRLKWYDREYVQYYALPNMVIIKEKDYFEFYPVYPNPVTEKVTISFYIPKKDIVSLFFLNRKDTTYILNHEPQERGFYKLTVDKKTLGFENETKRLYINCKSCDKKKNFGDIQF